MTKCVEVREARIEFVELLDSVHYGGQAVIIERSGKPMVAVIPIELYQRLTANGQTSLREMDGVNGRAIEDPS